MVPRGVALARERREYVRQLERLQAEQAAIDSDEARADVAEIERMIAAATR